MSKFIEVGAEVYDRIKNEFKRDKVIVINPDNILMMNRVIDKDNDYFYEVIYSLGSGNISFYINEFNYSLIVKDTTNSDL